MNPATSVTESALQRFGSGSYPDASGAAVEAVTNPVYRLPDALAG